MFAPSKRYWRVIELIKWGEHFFDTKGFDSPRREIEWLLTGVLSVSRVEIYLNFDKTVTKDQLTTLRSWVKRRISREPLQYITGKTEFFGLPFHVNPNALIPRPETERVVEVALEILEKIDAKRIVDVGTGCGSIAIAIATKIKAARIEAMDNDPLAIELAKANAKMNGVQANLEFQTADILKTDLEGPYDLLVSNPPYVARNELDTLMPEVRDYEPINALTDGRDGLQFYRRFAESARRWITSGGYMVLEVGLGSHPKKVMSLFRDAGYSTVESYQDYNGNERVVTVEVKH